MPELPEVETVRVGLERLVVGHKVLDVEVTGRRSIRRQSIEEFRSALVGRTFNAARRRGKYLLSDLDGGEVLVAHLRMSGQLLHAAPDEPLLAHTHVRLHLDSGDELRFVDPRTFGELFVAEELDARGVPIEIATLGIDPLLDGVDAKVLASLFARRRVPLKAFLLDQRGLCGIGNLYADEICFRARIGPLRSVDSLRGSEIGRLAAAIPEVLTAAVQARGSSLRDARYRDLLGGLGSYQLSHAVYDRSGEPCILCAKPIRRIRVAGRSTHYCPRCQR